MILLLKHDAVIESRHEEDQTVLHTAAYFSNIEVTRLLLEYNPDIETRDTIEQTPLHTAAYYGSREVVILLLKHKADSTARGLGKDILLCTSVSCNNTEGVKMLLIIKQKWKQRIKIVTHLSTMLPSTAKNIDTVIPET